METDIGVTFDVKSDGADGAHPDFLAAGIEYVFMRTVGVTPYTTWFDNFPDLYEKVYDKVEVSYPWYRVGFRFDENGELIGRGHAVTKMYRVLGGPGALANGDAPG
jgi:hypothetical protein